MNYDHIQVNTQSNIRIDGSNIVYFDPFKIEAETHDADLIAITHSHYDHFDPESINRIRKESTIFAAPSGMEKELGHIANAESLRLMAPGEEMRLPDLTITAVPAYNKMKPFHSKHNRWLGYVLEMDGFRYYIAGDTDAVKEIQNIRCDVALIPIGGTYTMNVKDAAGLINEIKPKAAIPTHYGSIVGKIGDADDFRKRVDPDIRVIIKL